MVQPSQTLAGEIGKGLKEQMLIFYKAKIPYEITRRYVILLYMTQINRLWRDVKVDGTIRPIIRQVLKNRIKV